MIDTATVWTGRLTRQIDTTENRRQYIAVLFIGGASVRERRHAAPAWRAVTKRS
jgi:hypothetical protein